MNRGFTVIEVLVTLVVIAILLGLGTVGLRSSLANARDAERQADIETIARGLERYYDRGNPFYIAGGTKGSYPGANMFISIDGGGWCPGTALPSSGEAAKYSVCREYFSDAFPGVSAAAATPPGFSSPQLRNPWLQSESSPRQIIMPYITQELNAGKYVYKALNSDDDGLCYDDTGCRRYALLYKKETTGEVVIVRSRHQQ